MKIMKEVVLAASILSVIALAIFFTVRMQSPQDKKNGNETETFFDEDAEVSTDITAETADTPSLAVPREAEENSTKGNQTATMQSGVSRQPAGQNTDIENKNICTLEIRCDALSNDLSKLVDPSQAVYIPADGIILHKTEVEFEEGENIYHLLLRICREKSVSVSASYTEEYKSMYVRGINNIFEFDAGESSGWLYNVNGIYPRIGSSLYPVKKGDTILWEYTLTYKGMWDD